MNTFTQIHNDLGRSKAQLLREAEALRSEMERLVARLQAGGTVNAMDSLGSRSSQFESALAEAVTLQNVLFHLEIEAEEEGESQPVPVASLTREERYETFRNDLDTGLFTVEDYKGRNFYEGPAVRVESHEQIQDVIRLTSIPLQYDDLGLGFIVYPR